MRWFCNQQSDFRNELSEKSHKKERSNDHPSQRLTLHFCENSHQFVKWEQTHPWRMGFLFHLQVQMTFSYLKIQTAFLPTHQMTLLQDHQTIRFPLYQNCLTFQNRILYQILHLHHLEKDYLIPFPHPNPSFALVIRQSLTYHRHSHLKNFQQ